MCLLACVQWEMVSGGCPVYCGMQAAAIREGVRHKGLRPEFTAGVAPEYVALAQACWAQVSKKRGRWCGWAVGVVGNLDNLHAGAGLFGAGG